MIVARLESVSKREPSRRDGLILTPGLIIVTDRSTPIGPNHTVPYGTVPLFAPMPGNKLPGYHHLVPPGQPSKEARKRLPQ